MHTVSEFHLKEMGNTLGEEKGTFMMRKEGNGEWSRLAAVEGISERQN